MLGLLRRRGKRWPKSRFKQSRLTLSRPLNRSGVRTRPAIGIWEPLDAGLKIVIGRYANSSEATNTLFEANIKRTNPGHPWRDTRKIGLDSLTSL